MSKIEQARTVYNANAGKVRKEVIAAIQQNMQISEVSAATYYATLKRQEKDAAAAGIPKVALDLGNTSPTPEGWAKVGAIATEVAKAEKPKYTPTKQRVSQPSTRKSSLDLFHDTLDTPEKVAEWQAELAEIIASGAKPLFGN